MTPDEGSVMTIPQESSSIILSIRPFQFNPTQRLWKESEDTYLQEYYKELSVKKIAQYLKRSPSAVRARANKLGIKKIIFTQWTEEEHRYLSAVYPTGDMKEIIQKLKRTKSAIYKKAFDLGLNRNQGPSHSQLTLGKSPKKLRRTKPRELPWKDTQLNFLQQQFSKMNLDELSQQIQRPKAEILSKLRQMFPVSIRKSLFYMLLTAEVDTLTLIGVDTEALQYIKDRALLIGIKWIQHPKVVCMRLIGFRLYIKSIITLAYNQITGTEDIPYQTEEMKIYHRRYRLRQDLYGGAPE